MVSEGRLEPFEEYRLERWGYETFLRATEFREEWDPRGRKTGRNDVDCDTDTTDENGEEIMSDAPPRMDSVAPWDPPGRLPGPGDLEDMGLHSRQGTKGLKVGDRLRKMLERRKS